MQTNQVSMKVINENELLTEEDFVAYIEKSPSSTELRIPVKTSFGGDYSVAMFFFDRERNATLFVPYYYGRQKQTVGITEYKKEQDAVLEEPPNTLYRGAPLETGLSVISYVSLGRPLKRKNSIPGTFVPHLQYPFVIEEFSGGLIEDESELFSEKHGLPIWVSNVLLSKVFEPRIMHDFSEHPHPQRKLFERYQKYLQGEMFSSDDDEEYEW